MDIDALTMAGTEYEDMIIGDSGDNMSAEEGAVGGAGGGDALSHYNYTALETMVSEVWQSARVRTPGVQLHEAAVLLLSALVVGVHGLLGLLPRSLLSLRAAWTALEAVLAVGLLFAAASLLCTLHAAFCRRLLRVAEDGDGEEEEDEDGGREDAEETLDESPADAASGAEDDLESIVSAQLEKEERVKRWIDNLCSDRDQVNFEACGEMKGRNMEAERSNADLLGDGQPIAVAAAAAPAPAPDPAPAAPVAPVVTPRCPRPLALPLPLLAPLPPLPKTLPTELNALSREGRRALSLAYELSVAVRQQTSSTMRATMSAPMHDGSLQDSLSDHKGTWKLVRRGKEALEESPAVPRPRGAPTAPAPAALASPLTAAPDPAVPQPPAAETPSWRRPLPPAVVRHPHDSTPRASAAAEVEAEAPEDEADRALNASSSLLNFVRRFSGTRFLLRELANATEGLRLRDSRSLSLQLEQRPAPESAGQRSALALPRAEVDTVAREQASAATVPHREKSNVMKVFSKGILSEGAVEFSTTSIQDAGRHQAAAAAAVAVAANVNKGTDMDMLGALSLLAQDASSGTRAPRTTTTATCTSDSETSLGGTRTVPARSTLNLGVVPRVRDLADCQDGLGAGAAPVTTSRGLTANMSEEGIPRSSRLADLDEHKSMFDLKKSLLTSIPEAAPPDEDFSHF